MCLQIEDRVNRLVDIVTEVDNTLIRFSKQDKVYYSDPKFHVSILSLLPTSYKETQKNYFDETNTYTVNYNYIPKTIHPNYYCNQDGDDDQSDDDDDDDFTNFLNKNKFKNINDKKEENVCSKIGISVECIECKIGDRIFRLNLRNDSGAADSCSFIEVI